MWTVQEKTNKGSSSVHGQYLSSDNSKGCFHHGSFTQLITISQFPSHWGKVKEEEKIGQTHGARGEVKHTLQQTHYNWTMSSIFFWIFVVFLLTKQRKNNDKPKSTLHAQNVFVICFCIFVVFFLTKNRKNNKQLKMCCSKRSNFWFSN